MFTFRKSVIYISLKYLNIYLDLLTHLTVDIIYKSLVLMIW